MGAGKDGRGGDVVFLYIDSLLTVAYYLNAYSLRESNYAQTSN